MPLRRAVSADAIPAARLVATVLEEFGLPFEPQGRDADVSWFGCRSDHDDFVVDDDGIVGLVSLGPQGDSDVGWISKLFVRPDFRGHGFGRKLLEAAHDAARMRGYERVGLRTRTIFHAAIALYEASGYVRDPSVPADGNTDDPVYYRPL